MKFNFPGKTKKQEKRPSYISMKRRVDNSRFLEQAKKRKRQTVIKRTNDALPANIKSLPLKRIFFTGIAIIIFVCVLVFFRSTSIFNVKEVLVISDKQENYNTIKKVVDGYINKNILFLSASEIETSIKKEVPSIHTVFVDKTLSGNLSVEVIEDLPVYYLANNNGIYLINQDGEVMEVIEPSVKLEFDETEKLLLQNSLPSDSDQVRLKYLSQFEESERDSIIWKDVSKEDKDSALNKMKEELNNRIADFNNKLNDQLKESRFKDLIGSFISNSESYSVGDQLSLDSLNFVSIVLDFFKSKGMAANKASWISEYTLEVALDGNPTVTLSVKRSYTEQFEDLNTLIYHGQFNGAKFIDVRSSNYSVVR